MRKSKRKSKIELLPFDAARYLTNDAAIAEYMTAVLELDDSKLLLLALGDIARARGMGIPGGGISGDERRRRSARVARGGGRGGRGPAVSS